MKTSKLAVVLAIALASGAAAAADAPNANEPQFTGAKEWFQASERVRQSEEQKARLERQGFPQYIP